MWGWRVGQQRQTGAWMHLSLNLRSCTEHSTTTWRFHSCSCRMKSHWLGRLARSSWSRPYLSGKMFRPRPSPSRTWCILGQGLLSGSQNPSCRQLCTHPTLSLEGRPSHRLVRRLLGQHATLQYRKTVVSSLRTWAKFHFQHRALAWRSPRQTQSTHYTTTCATSSSDLPGSRSLTYILGNLHCSWTCSLRLPSKTDVLSMCCLRDFRQLRQVQPIHSLLA